MFGHNDLQIKTMKKSYIGIILLHERHLTFNLESFRRSNFLDPQFVQIGQALSFFILKFSRFSIGF